MRGEGAGLSLGAESGRAHHLIRAHRQAGRDLGEIFAKADPHHEFLGRTEPSGSLGAHGPVQRGFQRREARRDPGKAMHLVLLARQQRRIDRPAGCNHTRDRLPHAFRIFARRYQGSARHCHPFAHASRASRAGVRKRTRKIAPESYLCC